MPKRVLPLTNTQLQKASPGAKEYNLSDGGGLAARIKPSGSILFIFTYLRPHTKKRANMSFGNWPDVSLDEARLLRTDARALLREGIDPQIHRDEQQAALSVAHNMTLEKVAADWFEVAKQKVTQDYADDMWRSLKLHVFPSLGDIPLHKLTAPQAIEAIQPLANAGKLEQVKRVCSRLNMIMDWAINSGFITHNCLVGIRKTFKSPTVTNSLTLKPEELPFLMSKLSTASIRPTTRHLIEWSLHTLARPGEAAGTKWVEIDWENELWIVPPERMKKRRTHIVPLSPQAINILKSMKEKSGDCDFVFPGDHDYRKHISNEAANRSLKRMGFDKKLVSHGLRSIGSTTLNEQGFDSDLIETALSHVGENAVRNAYNHAKYIQPRREMMVWWSDHIDTAATGNMSLSNNRYLKAVGE